MREDLPCQVGRHWGSVGGGQAQRGRHLLRGKRDLTGHCLIPPRSSPSRNTEKTGLGHPWAKERWHQNLGARKGAGQFQ